MTAADLLAVVRAVQIDADGAFTVGGGAPALPHEPLTVALAHALYLRLFARAIGVVKRDDENPVTEAALGRILSAANQSRDRWCEGWRIESVDGAGRIAAVRGRHRRNAAPGEYALTFTSELPPRAGMAAMLFLPRESYTLQAHVYYAFGETLAATEEEGRRLRAYIAASVDALPGVYERLTGHLNAQAVPFTLKTMLAPADRDRLDATVLYVALEDAARVESVLRALGEAHGARFGPDVPLFTRRIAPGIGMAESPHGNESFGMQRSRLSAEGLVDAWRAGAAGEQERLCAVRSRFAAAGIDPDRPHLAAPAPIALNAATVVGWLRSRGLAGGGEWTVTDRSSRNRNFAVARRDGTGLFVKQLRVAGNASLRMMEREAAVYEWAAGNGVLREILPAFDRFDSDMQLLITELLPGAESVAAVADRHRSAPIARAAAATLALLHAQPPPCTAVLDRDPPGILTAHRGGPLIQWLSPAQMQLVERIRENATLAAAFDRLAAEWRPRAPIHGDVKWENALWTDASGRLHWIDWELAAAGDPLWDAGCFVQSYLLHAPHTLGAGSLFLSQYAPACRETILRYAAARLAQSALEVMHGAPAPTPPALALLAAAAEITSSGSFPSVSS